jgi:hypothetical protein
VEFLVTEGITDGRPDWKAAVDEHHTRWRKK